MITTISIMLEKLKLFNFFHKKVFCNLFLIVLFFSQSFSQSSNIDIVKYDIKAKYNVEKKLLEFISTLNINKKSGVKSFNVLLSNLAKINKAVLNDSINFTYSANADNDSLSLILSDSYSKIDNFEITFQYSLPADSFIYGNVIFLRRENRWYPLQYDDFSIFNLEVNVPSDYVAFSVGNKKESILSKSSITYNYNHENYYSFPLIITQKNIMTLTSKSVNNISINFYFVSTDTAVNNKIIDAALSSFTFYQSYIGNYKYKHLNLIEIPDNQIQLVQSLSTIIMVGTPFINYFKLGYSNWPPHEIAHQWWGNGVFINSSTQNRWFLEESFNEYFRAIYLDNTFGKDSLQKQLDTYQATYNYIDKEKELPINEIKNVNTQENGMVIYQKGPLVVDKLRKLMGNNNWKDFVNELYIKHYGKFLTFDDFISTISKYDKNGNILSELNKLISEKGFTN